MNKFFSLIVVALALNACSGDPDQPGYQQTENVLDFCTKLKNASAKEAYSYKTIYNTYIYSEGKKITNPGDVANFLGQPLGSYPKLSFGDTDYACVISLSNQSGDVADVSISKVSN